MPGRRAFLIGCGSMVAAPAFAHLMRPSAPSPALQPPRPDAETSTTPEGVAGAESPLLRIDGWETPGDAGSAASGEAWVRINSSWQASWR